VTRVAKGPSDLDLIRDYLGGDVAAFDTLFKRYHKAIYGLTFRLLRDRQLAEDLTQETFFQILRTIHRINDSFNFSAWIHRIATNLCYDELRRRKKFPEAQEIDDEENEDSVLQVPDGDARKSPEVALEISELRDAVWSVARRLPEKYRLVLTLREQPYVEAAIASGTGFLRILWRHIVPNTLPPLLVQGTFITASAMITEAILSFIGAGTPPNIPSWGNIMAEGRSLFQVAYYIVLFPGIMLSVTVLAINLLGDGLRDALDPRLARRL